MPKEKEKATTYEVGYGNPPRRTQFQPGQSGNPKGRPKKRQSLKESIEKAARKLVTITANGKQQKMTTLEAAAMQVFNKAASGDIKAQILAFNLLKSEPLETGDKLSELVQEFKAVSARHHETDGQSDGGK